METKRTWRRNSHERAMVEITKTHKTVFKPAKTRTRRKVMVLLGRIELPASSLPMTRSTTELQQRSNQGAPYCRRAAQSQAGYLAGLEQ